MKHAAWIILLLGITVTTGCSSQAARPPGALVENAPVQTTLDAPAYVLHDDFLLERVASFELDALVLSAKRYRFGRSGRLAPVDLALGWGPMSDSRVLENLKVTQFRRYYMWRARQLPIPRREIETHSANMHMIPANSEIARRLKRIRRGDLVRISGHLVHASVEGRWRWRTSLTRDDTGNGACELVLVEDLVVLP